MATKEQRENVAANSVVGHLQALLGLNLAASKWDDGTADGMHDFFVEGPGHRIALEVSTIADGDRVGRDMRWAHKAPGGLVRVPKALGCWMAGVEPEHEVEPIAEALRSAIPELERLGVTGADTRAWHGRWLTSQDPWPDEHVYLRELHRVGVTDVRRVADAREETLREFGGTVQVLRVSGFTRPADQNFPVTMIHRELTDPDLHASDVTKLRSADATARHLWLWMDEEAMAMKRSFEAEGLPDADVEVEGVDGVWLGFGPAKNVVGAYVWLRGHGWNSFTVPRDETSCA